MLRPYGALGRGGVVGVLVGAGVAVGALVGGSRMLSRARIVQVAVDYAVVADVRAIGTIERD